MTGEWWGKGGKAREENGRGEGDRRVRVKGGERVMRSKKGKKRGKARWREISVHSSQTHTTYCT